jgi:hypothetical protein
LFHGHRDRSQFHCSHFDGYTLPLAVLIQLRVCTVSTLRPAGYIDRDFRGSIRSLQAHYGLAPRSTFWLLRSTSFAVRHSQSFCHSVLCNLTKYLTN